ncbi:XRE family transcriptional regulator [Clostridium sp. OF13-4]|jgi:transcriptional regulator with XRE-family HTH domain|nr:XRE family transcriptional regulator [Clostridium sp. OF13-4]
MAGYTQKDLSEQSGVTLRSIQQYEQGKKKIQKASAETVRALARSLGCQMEDLL